MDVNRLALEAAQLLRPGVGKLQVRDVNVGFHCGTVHFVDEANHAVDVIKKRKFERLELEGDLNSKITSIITELAQVTDADLPLLQGLNDLLFPDIFPQNQQNV